MRPRFPFSAVFTLTFLLLSFAVLRPAHAQTEYDYDPVACPYTDSPHYRPNIAETVQGNNLLLIDTATNAVLMTLDDSVLTYHQRSIYWLQNCRYLLAQNIYRPYGETYPRRFTRIYDTLTGAYIFESGREIWFETRFSPTQDQFIIKGATGTYLMSESLPSAVFLFLQGGYSASMRYYEWDMARNQLLVSFIRNSGYLMIYDIHTAALLDTLSQPDECSPTPVFYTKSADARYLILYTFRGEPSCVTVYDRDAGAVVAQVNGEQSTAHEPERFALSPDGRYLVIGLRALRVWDLWNLPEAFADRLPIYRYEGPIQQIDALHFISNEVVETTAEDTITQWNILTGAQIGT